MERLTTGRLESQRLLTPIVLEMTSSQRLALLQHGDTLEKFGLDTSKTSAAAACACRRCRHCWMRRKGRPRFARSPKTSKGSIAAPALRTRCVGLPPPWRAMPRSKQTIRSRCRRCGISWTNCGAPRIRACVRSGSLSRSTRAGDRPGAARRARARPPRARPTGSRAPAAAPLRGRGHRRGGIDGGRRGRCREVLRCDRPGPAWRRRSPPVPCRSSLALPPRDPATPRPA